MLIIFYDGQCPLCAKEMQALKKQDANQQIQLEDLHQSDFQKRFPEVNQMRAMQILHGKLDNQWLYGLDVTYHAWRIVGKGWMVAFLRWPLLKPIADKCYLFFARHRQRISRLLMKKGCDNGSCTR